MKSELEQLREEVAALRKEVADLRADRTVHHYHHQAAPAPFAPTVGPFVHPGSPSVTPSYPYWPGYFPSVASGQVTSDAPDSWPYNGGGTMI